MCVYRYYAHAKQIWRKTCQCETCIRANDAVNHFMYIAGPPEKDKAFYKLKDEENKVIHHSLKGSSRNNYRQKMEDWESAKVLLSPLGNVVTPIPISEALHTISDKVCYDTLKEYISLCSLQVFVTRSWTITTKDPISVVS